MYINNFKLLSKRTCMVQAMQNLVTTKKLFSRDNRYATLDPEHIRTFTEMLGQEGVTLDKD